MKLRFELDGVVYILTGMTNGVPTYKAINNK